MQAKHSCSTMSWVFASNCSKVWLPIKMNVYSSWSLYSVLTQQDNKPFIVKKKVNNVKSNMLHRRIWWHGSFFIQWFHFLLFFKYILTEKQKTYSSAPLHFSTFFFIFFDGLSRTKCSGQDCVCSVQCISQSLFIFVLKWH